MSPTTRANPPSAESDLFHALADPTRRAIFERLCEESRPVGVLAAGLPVSRPAVSQHLRVLEKAGLVRAESRDTRRIYSPRLEGLGPLRAWVERHWDVVLGRFAEAAEEAEREARRREAGTAPENPKEDRDEP